VGRSELEVVVSWDGDPLVWEHGATPEIPPGLDLSGVLAEVPDDGSWSESRLGALVVMARRHPLPRYRHRAPQLDRGLAWSMTAAMALGIAFVFAVGFVPPAGTALTVEALTDDHPLLAYVHAPLADEPVPQSPLPIDGSGPITDGPGQPMEEAAGVSGATDGPRSRRGRIRFRGETEVTQRVPRAAPDPREVGILGVLASLEDAERPGALAGVAEIDGWTRDDAYGRPLADLVGQGHGTDGFDMVGTGRGGCWPGDEDCAKGTVGVGPGVGWGGTGWGTTCDDTCRAFAGGGGYGSGIINLEGREVRRRYRRRRGSAVPNPIRRVQIHRDRGLSRDEVRRAIRRHRDALRHCYAGAAAAAAGEAGEVEIGLAISPDGRVLSSEVVEDTLDDVEVARCIAAVVARTRFPEAPVATVATVPFGLDVFGGG
jgi:hypothetical protein